LLGACLTAALAARLGPGHGGAAKADTRPNVVVVVLDDVRDDDWAQMPRTREIVEVFGTRFPNHVMTTPLCTPSRVTALTGAYAHNHGVEGNGGKNGGWRRFDELGVDATYLPARLHAAGYRTALVGKLMNGTPLSGSIGAGWDDWLALEGPAFVDPWVNDAGTERQVAGHEADALQARALRFIDETPAEQPLLLWFAPSAAHTPAIPREGESGFRGWRVPRTRAFNERKIDDKPEFVRARKRLDRATIRKRDETFRQRLRSLQDADAAVVAIWEALTTSGRSDNTYLFVTSDNGYVIGEHRFVGKTVPYDPALRASLFARGPAFPQGVTDDRLVGNVDLAPTIAAVAGVTLDGADGASLLDEALDRQDILIEWHGAASAEGDSELPRTAPHYAGVRTARHLYVEYATGERELYDYENDPHELVNMLSRGDRRRILTGAEALAADLEARLAALRDCAGATCR
jgi:arylsulfatase A-like enzyme